MKFELDSWGEKNSKQFVRLIYERRDKEREPHHETVPVRILGGYSTAKAISVTVIAAIYPKLIFLDVNKKTLDALNFGSTFYGKSKTLTGFLVNSGAESINFSVMHAPNENNINGYVRVKENDTDSCFSFLPSDGIVKPFSQTKIIIMYSPIQEKQLYGFEKQLIEDVKNSKILRDEFFIEVPAINQRMLLTVQGIADISLVTISPSIFRFGSCAIHDRRDIQVRQELHISFFILSFRLYCILCRILHL